MADIRSNTVLPAVREPLWLRTADDLRLVAELALPAQGVARGTVVCLHPLPTHGGSMDSHVLRKMAWRLPALAGIAVLRLNTRGTTSPEGTSEGAFDGGEGEALDLAAALDLVGSRDLPRPWVLGWSFGSELVLRHAIADPTPVGGILLAPPLHRTTDSDLARWADDGRPLVAVVPELDDYLRPLQARERFAVVPQVDLRVVAGSKHLFVGHVEQVLDIVADAVVPGVAPLARTF